MAATAARALTSGIDVSLDMSLLTKNPEKRPGDTVKNDFWSNLEMLLSQLYHSKANPMSLLLVGIICRSLSIRDRSLLAVNTLSQASSIIPRQIQFL